MDTVLELHPLVAYLQAAGGEEILHFDDANGASEAARQLRDQFPELEVRASYDRVFIRC